MAKRQKTRKASRTTRAKRDKRDKRTKRDKNTRRKPKKAKFFKSLYRKSITKVRRMRDIIVGARDDGSESFQVQNDYTPKVYTYIKRNYGENIVALHVCRKPIRKTIEAALNLVSFGSWSTERKKFGYDDFYHLFLVGETETGRKVVIEKNEVIRVKDYTKAEPTDCMEVPMSNPIKLGVMMKKTETSMKDYFLYDAFHNNCQVFVENVLSANSLLQPELVHYISQELGEVLKSQPTYLSNVARNITDTGGRVKRFTSGKTDRNQIKQNLREMGVLTSDADKSLVDDEEYLKIKCIMYNETCYTCAGEI
jgi:hypothetical protein